ncbi:MAG: RluA family pseudouridine synthase [Bacteroidetes bacterium]|nr:MAG: RluA family pseudouridine synthase [Bacteroidota bacterium]
MNHFSLKLTALHAGRDLLSLLIGRYKGIGPERAEVALHKGFVRVNGLVVRENRELQKGDLLEADFTWFLQKKIFAEDLPLDVRYEDDDILVVNKAAGMACHAGLGVFYGTLLNAVMHYHQQNGIKAIENGIVHRLDKETSGLILLARSEAAFKVLKPRFAEEKNERRYHAWLAGTMEADAGELTWAMGRDPENERCIKVMDKGKACLTKFKTQERVNNMSLVEAYPLTGRTHQLRVHFSHAGHPILGDKRYGGETQLSRMYLFASALGFLHPLSGKPLYIELDKAEISRPEGL